MKLELTVEELRELASGEVAFTVHEPEQEIAESFRDPDKYPPLEWSLSMMTGRLVASCPTADASMPLYEVWHNGDEWLAMVPNVNIEPFAVGPLVFCLDKCREDFMDKIEADRSVADAARQVS